MKTQERKKLLPNFLIIGLIILFISSVKAAATPQVAPVTTAATICNAIANQRVTVPITVTGFTNISGFTLTLDYEYTKLHFVKAASSYNSSLGGTCAIGEIDMGGGIKRVTISWYRSGSTGSTLADGSAIANYVFTYISGPATLTWFDMGPSCVYNDPDVVTLTDTPASAYYINGSVSGSCLSIPTITADGPTNFCDGGSVNLTASVGSSYLWSTAATTQSINVTSSGSYTVEVTDAGGAKATSAATVITVAPGVIAQVSIQASETTVCPGTQVTYTATLTNPGDNPSYTWKVNGTTFDSRPTFIYAPANGDQITCTIWSNAPCASNPEVSSDPITMTVTSGLVVGVSIEASATTVCPGQSVTFTPLPTNEGQNPSYAWYINNTIASYGTSLTYNPQNNDVVKCTLYSDAACVNDNERTATSNEISITVSEQLPASVTISASANPACAGTEVTFIATPVNGGNAAYQWYNGTSPVGDGNATYSYIPEAGDVISVVMTSGLTSCVTNSPATSNSIVMQVDEVLPASVTISASANPVCAGTVVTFIATPVNGGNAAYQWYNGTTAVGDGNATYSYIPEAGDVISLVMTSGLTTCVTNSPATSNSVLMQVDDVLPASVSISASANPVCSGTEVTFTAIPVNGGNAIYQWYKNDIEVTTAESYSCIPENGDEIYVVMNSSFACVSNPIATSNTIQLEVYSTGQWLGFTNDWNDASNWCGGIPSPTTDVLIPEGVVKPVIGVTVEATCRNIDIAQGASLTIESNETGTGSFIISGTVSGPGLASVQRYMTTDAWHIASSPVSGQSISDFLATNVNVAQDVDNNSIRGMMDYNPQVNNWNSFFTNSTSGNLEPGKGFCIRNDANGAINFTGTLNAGFQSVSGLISEKWNCIGNPYTSAIGVNNLSSGTENFLEQNALNLDPNFGAIYIWDNPDENNGIWGIYTIISNTPDPSPGGFDIQQGQAFMVKMDKSANSVNFNSNMQLHNTNVQFKSTNRLWPSIRLNVSSGNQHSSTLIAFNHEMSKGLDPTYDAGLLKGSADLSIYSFLVENNGIPFAIQALPENENNNLVIPVGLDFKSGGEITISSELFNLPQECLVILEDKSNKTFTDLSKKVYTTYLDVNSSIADRFLLHTSYLTTGSGLDISDIKLNAFSIRNVEIRINGKVSKKAVATLFDIQGRTVLIKNLDEGSVNVIQTQNIKTAVYLLLVNDNGKLQSFKIYMKE
ncbi:MAG: hypothetical protein WAO52_12135 [Prolixibacteraceae bacterium]